MPKGLLVESGTRDYGFISRSNVYTPQIAAATGITPVESIPSGTVPCPYRISDLLQAGVMFTATAVMSNGPGKRISRRLFVSSTKKTTYRLLSAANGLIGLQLGGKTIVSVSRSRKASFTI
ncbi:hypothetical protein [Microcoleus sp. herbarium14]|uniref:hypothetical protein n=1 Tax=Microcoleus sp. herbarium14 TaxID=3055439 RepID=UPI002FD4948A